MPDKIIFLDIDGPMIPDTQFLINPDASWQQQFADQAVMVLKKIIEASNAKIVFNSYHNRMLHPCGDNTPGLYAAAEVHGLTPHLHKDVTTSFPNPMKAHLWPPLEPGEDSYDHRRLNAIYEWLHDHYDMSKTNQVLWIALDDAKIDHKRAHLVAPDAGLTITAYNHAAKFFNFKKFISL